MKKLNLLKISAEELNSKQMESVVGGGVSCSAKCGTDYNAGANKMLSVLRDNNQTQKPDTLKKFIEKKDEDKINDKSAVCL